MDTHTKDAGMRVRVARDLRDAFVEACRANGTPAACELREFMESYVAKHGGVRQGDLFKRYVDPRRAAKPPLKSHSLTAREVRQQERG